MSQMAHISIHAINHTKSTNNYTPTQSEHYVSTGCFLVIYLGVKCKKLCLTHVSMSRKQINSRKREFSQQAGMFCHGPVPITSPHSKPYLSPFFFFSQNSKDNKIRRTMDFN